jgi:hypothetical protein
MSMLLMRQAGARSALPARQAGEAAPSAGQHGRPGEAENPGEYALPLVVDIGEVRDLTAGSASSGNKDANSQYYW